MEYSFLDVWDTDEKSVASDSHGDRRTGDFSEILNILFSLMTLASFPSLLHGLGWRHYASDSGVVPSISLCDPPPAFSINCTAASPSTTVRIEAIQTTQLSQPRIIQQIGYLLKTPPITASPSVVQPFPTTTFPARNGLFKLASFSRSHQPPFRDPRGSRTRRRRPCTVGRLARNRFAGNQYKARKRL